MKTKKTQCSKCGVSAGRLSLIKGKWLCARNVPKNKPSTVIRMTTPWH